MGCNVVGCLCGGKFCYMCGEWFPSYTTMLAHFADSTNPCQSNFGYGQHLIHALRHLQEQKEAALLKEAGLWVADTTETEEVSRSSPP